MAGVTGKRLRLTTARRPSYFRGGLAIGTTEAPTYLEQGDVTLEQALEIVRDPNIALAFEDEDGVHPLTDEDRAEVGDALLTALGLEPLPDPKAQHLPAAPGPNTAEPQGEGTTPDGSVPAAEASQASDAVVAPADGAVSADGAVTTEPTAQHPPAAPEPAAEPKPASRARGKARGTAAG